MKHEQFNHFEISVECLNIILSVKRCSNVVMDFVNVSRSITRLDIVKAKQTSEPTV